MKCVIPEISWHNRDPVLSVDFQPIGNGSTTLYRLATGGTDTHVLVWLARIDEKDGASLEFVSDLKRHNRAVNVVRFSPSGELLASGDDEAAIWLWKQQEKGRDVGDLFLDDSEKENKENWSAIRTLRGHIEDVYDLCWSPNSLYLVSGSVDNTAIIWDITKGRSLSLLSDHKGFVQGVAWDPQDQYVATLCSDRVCRIYNIATKKVVHKIYKTNLSPSTVKSPMDDQKASRLFHDDTLKSFFRRLVFTPDGELLITPAGIVEVDDGSVLHVTHVFSRHSLTKPAFYLLSKDKHTLAVRCCPTLFKLRPVQRKNLDCDLGRCQPWEIHSTMLKLPYRMVFAIATQDSVLFYDTQQPAPFAKVANIQYTRLSDLSWSRDGRILIVSSTDGYCSLVTFDENELGVVYKEETPAEVARGIDATPESQSADKLPAELDISPGESGCKSQSTTTTPIGSLSQKASSGRKQVSLITLFSPKSKKPGQNVKSALGDKSVDKNATKPTPSGSDAVAKSIVCDVITIDDDALPMDVDDDQQEAAAVSAVVPATDDTDAIATETMTQILSIVDDCSLPRDHSLCVQSQPAEPEPIGDVVASTIADILATVGASTFLPQSDVILSSSKPLCSSADVGASMVAVNVSPTVRQPRRVQLVTLSTTPKTKK